MSARIEEIRQENRSGDVSYADIEWLCQVAEAADELRLWEPGRRGYAAAFSRLTAALARAAATEQQRP